MIMLHEESDLYLRKQRLRKLIREEWGRCSREELESKSSSAVSTLLNNRYVLAAHAVAIYSSLPDEVNTSDAIAKLMTMGKEVFLPVVISETEMILRHYTGQGNMHKGSYGIMEPDDISANKTENTHAEPSVNLDVIIVPGVAFDSAGHRLGRGKGYYDRFLSSLTCHKIGLCYDYQFFDEIPSEPFDVAMDEVIYNR